mmetsp:Transcript_6814/g.15753  ORF Transcript_6814/g.15753 Transcript_6814/m.15753 type:complete len:105 (-) Transcript_6814:90-404(-)
MQYLHQLETTGEIYSIHHQFKARLASSEWRGRFRARAKQILRERQQDDEKISMEQLIREMVPVGRECVPGELKSDLIRRLESVIDDKDDKDESARSATPTGNEK